MTDVRICELTRAVSHYAWLCASHRFVRERRGFSVKVSASVTGLCDDCPPPEQPAAVDFAPTTATARLVGGAATGRADEGMYE